MLKRSVDLETLKRKPYEPDQALSMFVSGRMTKARYIAMRNASFESVPDQKKPFSMFPPYHVLADSKEQCYIPFDSDETSATCSLQDLLDKTVHRLYEADSAFFESTRSYVKCEMVWKWGLDSATGFAEINQAYATDSATGSARSDASLMNVSTVPLQLETMEGKVLWKNPVPNSPRYCRPIRLAFEKETVAITREEVRNIEEQIANLNSTQFETKSGTIFDIKHEVYCTMLDGKVICALTGTYFKCIFNLK